MQKTSNTTLEDSSFLRYQDVLASFSTRFLSKRLAEVIPNILLRSVAKGITKILSILANSCVQVSKILKFNNLLFQDATGACTLVASGCLKTAAT